MHERMARPLSSTVHAPHTPTPQPYFVPSRPRRSPNTHSSGMRPSASTSRPTPLTISENVGIGALDVRYDDLDAILAAEDPRESPAGVARSRVSSTDADPERRHSAGARRTRFACVRDDRKWENRRVSASDPASPRREAARHHARARADADARARRADSRRPHRPGRAHANHRGGRVRRRRNGTAGARLSQRRRRDRRHAGSPARSFPRAVREARGPRVPRARRSRPDARHGIPARHPACTEASAAAAANVVLQRHNAASDRRAGAGYAARPHHY